MRSGAQRPDDRRFLRPMLSWTAGMLAILALVWAASSAAACYRQTKAALNDKRLAQTGWYDSDARRVVETLGGPDRARLKLVACLRLPESCGVNRSNAVRALCACGPRAVPVLVPLLLDRDAQMRDSAAGALGYLDQQAPAAVLALAAALSDADGDVRVTAAWALTRMGPVARDAAPALAEALDGPDAKVHGLAVAALYEMGPCARCAMPALIRALADPDEYVRRFAASALSRVGPSAKKAVPAIERLLNDPVENVRDCAKAALEEINGTQRPNGRPAFSKDS